MTCKVGGTTPSGNFNVGDYPKEPQKVNQQNQEMPSVFGFKDNGNGIVDKEDFSDTDMLKLAEEKGHIGKKWSEVLGDLQVDDKFSNLAKTQKEEKPEDTRITKTLFKRLGFDSEHTIGALLDAVAAGILTPLGLIPKKDAE